MRNWKYWAMFAAGFIIAATVTRTAGLSKPQYVERGRVIDYVNPEFLKETQNQTAEQRIQVQRDWAKKSNSEPNSPIGTVTNPELLDPVKGYQDRQNAHWDELVKKSKDKQKELNKK